MNSKAQTGSSSKRKTPRKAPRGRLRRANGNGSLFKKMNRGGSWYLSYYDENGRRMTRCTFTTDRAVAERILSKCISDVALRREGVIDGAAVDAAAQARQPIDVHVKDFRKHMQAAARDKGHVVSTIRYVQRVAEACKWKCPANMSASDLVGYSADLMAKGQSHRTCQAAITAVKAFSKWLVVNGRLGADPLTGVPRPSPETDRRRVRRFLLPQEWRHLDAAARSGPVRDGLSGQDRALLYASVIETGLRQKEVRSLLAANCRLDAGHDRPHITLPSRHTKNKEPARLYLRPALAQRLKEHLARVGGGEPVFGIALGCNVAEFLRHDLAAARAAYLAEACGDAEELERRTRDDFLLVRSHEGEVLDFHALRLRQEPGCRSPGRTPR
jgi:integrase